MPKKPPKGKSIPVNADSNDPIQNTGQTEKRELVCRLTQPEFNERAMELAKLEDDIAALECEKKRAADTFKGKIEGLEVRRAEVAGVVRRQSELREIECTWFADWVSKSMILRRMDTMEAVDARTMTAEEMQTGFAYPEQHYPRAPENRQLPPQRDESDDEEPPTVEPS